MMLQKKTDLGTLMARYKKDEAYPGFWVDLRHKDKGIVPLCNVEYDSSNDCIQVVVYKDVNSEEPTDILRIYV